jgi:hypothetical protein
MKKLLTGIAALFLATSAHSGEFPKQQVWQCGDPYIVVNPIDLTWDYNRADFARGEDRFTIWHNHLYQRYGLQDIPCAWVRKQPYLTAAAYAVYLGGLAVVL